MSSISGITQGISQFLQSLQSSGSNSSSNTSQGIAQFIQSLQNSNGSTSNSSSSNSLASTISQDIGKFTGHAGKHHQHALFKKISDAVVGALNSQTNSASGNTAAIGPNPPTTTTDPNQKIENAIVNILKSATNTTNGSNNITDSETDANSPTSGQSLLQSLQQNGVTPEQFRNDLLAALQQTQGSTQSFATLASNFPPGLLVNTVG
jgi:hypothetical protein